MKTDRLKKLESELKDLEQWMNLGLVPKKEEEKHLQEIEAFKSKIEEEKEKICHLKENGSLAEYITPSRKLQGQAAYSGNPSFADMGVASDDTSSGFTEEASNESDEGSNDHNRTTSEETSSDVSDPFRGSNRWGREIIDPDSDEW